MMEAGGGVMVLRRESQEERQKKEILKYPARECPPSLVPGANLDSTGRHQKVPEQPCPVDDAPRDWVSDIG